jgi:hypothetical protein
VHSLLPSVDQRPGMPLADGALSKDFSSWCSPPVTKMGMPARCASSMVADTVVAPSSCRAITTGRSLREVFCTCCNV